LNKEINNQIMDVIVQKA